MRKKYKESWQSIWTSLHRDYAIKKIGIGNAITKAIKNGDIKREPCSVCGHPRAEGHHEDYDKPLDVIWLCSNHHKARHKEINKLRKIEVENYLRDKEKYPHDYDGSWTPRSPHT